MKFNTISESIALSLTLNILRTDLFGLVLTFKLLINYLINLELALVLCYLKQIYLLPSSATMCREEMLQRLQLIERGEIHIEKPTYLSIYNKNYTIYILVTSENNCVYALSPTFLYDNSTPILLKQDLQRPEEPRIPPGIPF